MARPIIIARGLEITYNLGKSNEFKALSGANTDIYKGEYIILFGPSGSGKSTLMYSVMGSLPPSGGTLLVKGDDIYSFPPSERVFYQRNVMGIIYQQFNLIPSLMVRDNVALPLIFAEVDKATRNRRAQQLLERFGVGEVGDKRPAMLSGGQQQRVSVARSMVNEPEILLADEPTGNLDSVATGQVMAKIKEINDSGVNIMMVSHNAAHLPFAHRVFYLRDGRIVREVVNPERKQIKKVAEGEALITELEQLARLWPYDSVETLRVKSIVNYITQELNFNQLERLEKAVRQLIRGNIQKKQFIEYLNRKISQEGIGLSSLMANKMANGASVILKESQNIRRFRTNRHLDLAFFHQEKFVKRLEEHLTEESGRRLSKEQKKNMESAIVDRLSGSTESNFLFERFNCGIRKGGVGLHSKTAYTLASYFEKLLSQGVSYEIEQARGH